MRLSLPEDVTPYVMLEPAADAAGRTSAYLSIRGAVRAWIVVHMNQGNAATVLLSPLQATAVAGTGTKAINAIPIWHKQDEVLVNFTKATDAATFTTDAAVKKKFVIFELDPERALDVANSFDCVAVSTGASNAANITSATLWIQNRHHGTAVVASPLTD